MLCKLDRVKSLFAKNHRVISEESIFNRLMEEIRCINHALEAIRSDQQRIEVTLYQAVEMQSKLDTLEKKVDLALKVVGVEQTPTTPESCGLVGYEED